MAFISWDESYSVKVAEMDGHHQKLFSLLNALHDAMRQGKGRNVMARTIAELGDYVNVHFAAEEALMQKARYRGLPGHQVEHRRFAMRIADFRKDLEAGTGGNAVAVLEFLKGWLKNHIQKLDRSYSAELNANGIH